MEGETEKKKPDNDGRALRIGVYVCHCGSNIGGVIDCKAVAEYASTLPGVVVSRDNRYTCSDAGQEEIKKDIVAMCLNRVVVASCSPNLHEHTFRRAVAEAGLNPFLFNMVNIREQCSWVHGAEKVNATRKAKALVSMGVARVSLLESLTPNYVDVEKSCLIIGGGIAGMQAALDLGDMGFKVYLVEQKESIGGRMAQLDKTFPTGDCAICILAPKMVDVSRHPNIDMLTYSEIKSVKGYVGNYDVTVLKKPRYVDESKCIGCGACTEKCPTKVPNEFDQELSERKAIYVPFPQAVPLKYTIDRENCIHFKTGKCGLCEKTCTNKAIDFEQKGKEMNFRVGAIIVATGADAYVPMRKGVYGYWEHDNVITALELERLINAAGPTNGHITRPSDGKEPKRVAFIQCVGSRNWKIANKYCSRVCCMYTMKNAQIIKEHIPDAKISVYYIDVRAFGKGFEEFYHRVREEYGVEYIRGRPAKVIENPKTKNLVIRAEETLLNKITEREFDLVVLSVGLVPSKGSEELARLLNISRSPDGFFQEAHPKLKPVDTAMEGIYICGCAHSPKDIPDTVAQAKAAASSAAVLMSKGKLSIEPLTAFIDETKCIGCGLCAELCPYKAPQPVETEAGTKMKIIEALCRGCGTCVASCPQKAIDNRQFRNIHIEAEITAALDRAGSDDEPIGQLECHSEDNTPPGR